MCCCGCCFKCCNACCCGQCHGTYLRAFLSAIFTAAECVFFFGLNVLYMLTYYCNLEPPRKDNLGANFIEDVWAWFLYSNSSCQSRFGNSYTPPAWITPVPIYFTEGVWHAVEADTGINYQISYSVLHILWFASCFLLLYGNIRKLHFFYIPYLFFGTLILLLDLSLGGLYIGFMAQMDFKGDDWAAPFSMLVFYFRGFLFLIINIAMLLHVASAFFKTCWKRRELRKYRNDVTIQINTTIQQASQPPRRSSETAAEPSFEQSFAKKSKTESIKSFFSRKKVSNSTPQNELTPPHANASAPPRSASPPDYKLPASNPAFLMDDYQTPKKTYPDLSSVRDEVDKYQPFSYTNPSHANKSTEKMRMEKFKQYD